MANTSISNLAAGAAVSATDLVPNVQTAGVGPVKTTAAQLKTFMSASPTLITPDIGAATGTSLAVTGAFTTGTQQSVQGSLVLANTAAGAFSTTLRSSNSATAAWTLTLPVAVPAANGAILTSLTTGVSSWTSVLPVANGGTNASSAGITAFNNITGYTASGATGTTSTNLVFSASPTFTGTVTAPIIDAGAATALSLRSANTAAISADTSQNVGIGAATTPAAPLHLRKDQNGTTAFLVQNRNGSGTPVSATQFVTGGLDIGDNRYAEISSSGGGSCNLSFKTSNAGAPTEKFSISAAGVLAAPLLSSGAGTNAVKWNSTGGTITYEVSSARYKKNIRNSIYGLADILKLRSAMFEYKDIEYNGGKTDVGLIAEEVDLVIPELVPKNSDNEPVSVSYDRMVSVLIKAIQELKAEFDAYKAAHP